MAEFMPVPPGGVAGQEHGPLPEPLRELDGELEGPDPLERDRQVGHARGEPDPPGEPLLVERGGVVLARLPEDAVEPAVAAPGREEDAGRVRVVDVVAEVAALADHGPERRSEE